MKFLSFLLIAIAVVLAIVLVNCLGRKQGVEGFIQAATGIGGSDFESVEITIYRGDNGREISEMRKVSTLDHEEKENIKDFLFQGNVKRLRFVRCQYYIAISKEGKNIGVFGLVEEGNESVGIDITGGWANHAAVTGIHDVIVNRNLAKTINRVLSSVDRPEKLE